MKILWWAFFGSFKTRLIRVKLFLPVCGDPKNDNVLFANRFSQFRESFFGLRDSTISSVGRIFGNLGRMRIFHRYKMNNKGCKYIILWTKGFETIFSGCNSCIFVVSNESTFRAFYMSRDVGLFEKKTDRCDLDPS